MLFRDGSKVTMKCYLCMFYPFSVFNNLIALKLFCVHLLIKFYNHVNISQILQYPS